MLNPDDEIAVEEALRIKEKVERCEIVLMALGDEETNRTLRYAFAMGGPKIDKMIRIGYDHFDPWTASLLLAKAIEKIGFDIILCGSKIIDNNSSEVGGFVSEFLDIPQISGIVNLEIHNHERKTVVERYLGRGDREEVECPLPALFSTARGLNDPRYPTAPDRFLAERATIDIIDPQCLGIDLTETETLTPIKKLAPPRLKTKKVFIPDINLSASERLDMMKSGGGTQKTGGAILEGTEEEASQYILDFLTQNKILKEGSAH